MVVSVFFGIAFLRDWNENGPFPVLWPLLSFPNYAATKQRCSLCIAVIYGTMRVKGRWGRRPCVHRPPPGRLTVKQVKLAPLGERGTEKKGDFSLKNVNQNSQISQSVASDDLEETLLV